MIIKEKCYVHKNIPVFFTIIKGEDTGKSVPYTNLVNSHCKIL